MKQSCTPNINRGASIMDNIAIITIGKCNNAPLLFHDDIALTNDVIIQPINDTYVNVRTINDTIETT
jgi:hypothetical protein